MKPNIDKQSILKLLEGEELSAVVFVRNYLQLQFDGPALTAYVWPIVKSSRGISTNASTGYRDVLCEQIGKTVSSVMEEVTKVISLHFSDGTAFEFALDKEDCASPERLMLISGKGKIINVWRFRGE